jgi:hypothetical protein
LFHLRKITIAAVLSVTGLMLLGTQPRIVFAKGEQAPVASERSHVLAEGEYAAKQLLLLMDRDKSGKVSRAEFMSFMEAELIQQTRQRQERRTGCEGVGAIAIQGQRGRAVFPCREVMLPPRHRYSAGSAKR